MQVAHPQLPPLDTPPGQKTDVSTWTDFTIDDEVAVLLSLVLAPRSGRVARLACSLKAGTHAACLSSGGHRPPHLVAAGS